MLGSIRNLSQRVSPRALNWISRVGFVVSIAGVTSALLVPQVQVISGVAALISTALVFCTREISHMRNQSLRALVAQLERRPRPQESTAAAFTAQGELATMNYPNLIERLRQDGHIR